MSPQKIRETKPHADEDLSHMKQLCRGHVRAGNKEQGNLSDEQVKVHSEPMK